MNERSKYYALFVCLRGSGQVELSLTFAEIEALTGKPLPASARAARGWWSNRDGQGTLQARAWIEAGYNVTDIDLDGERVTFRKIEHVYTIRRKGGQVIWDRHAIKALRLQMGLNQVQFAEELGVRQQTISEWETGAYAPRRAMAKYLTIIAERAGVKYEEE